MPFDLALYLVTDAALCAETGLEATVEAAVKGGVTMVQLRDKHASDEAMIAQATRLKALLEGSGVPLIINDRLSVAIASGADGLHVGQSDTAVQEARAALGPQAILGLSINTLAQLREIRTAVLKRCDSVATSQQPSSSGKSSMRLLPKTRSFSASSRQHKP